MPTEESGPVRPATPAIAVIGSYAKALVVTAPRIPVAGETLIGQDYRETFGGKGSDMAVQAARLGAGVEFVGVVGNDPHGREFLALMAGEGVGTAGVRVTDDRPTGVGLIIKDDAGHNIIVVAPGANELFGAADIDRASTTLAAAQVVLAQLEIPLRTALDGLARAKADGAITVLNPAPAVDLVADRVSLIGIDVITPNDTEARVLLGHRPDADIDNATIAVGLQALGAAAVVITRGEDGVDVFDGDSYHHVPGHVVDVVDSNGAGDSFNAGLAVALAEGRSLVEAAGFANAVAALCCEGWETVPSYRDRATVDAFLGAVTR